MPRRLDIPHKYAVLLRYLQALPPEQETAVLTFTAIEALIAAPLPASAWNRDFWYLNTWNARQPTGFRGRLLRPTRSVEFRRVTA